MHTRGPRISRRLAALGAIVASTMVLFGAIPVSEAAHQTPACGNDATGEAFILGCRNEVDHTTKIKLLAGATALALESRAGDIGSVGLRAIANDRAIHAQGATGVFGSGGTGLHGTSRGGTGVRAQSSAGTALHVLGKATFTRSGKTSIGQGLTQKDVSLGNLSSATIVTATVQGVPISGLYVLSVQVQPSQNRFRIHLSKAVPAGKSAVVGWFVVN